MNLSEILIQIMTVCWLSFPTRSHSNLTTIFI